MTNEQRKAMFARMRAKLTDQKVLKRAAIGAAMVGTGAVIAKRNPAMLKQAMGLMATGGAIAAGYGGRAYQTAKDEAEKRGHTAQAVARQWKDHLVQEGQRKGGDVIANAIDMPFSWLEGMAAANMDRRTRNIESVFARYASGAQAYATDSAYTRAKKLSRLNLAAPRPMDPRTKLRREVDNKKWTGLMEDMKRAAMASGQDFYVHSHDELARLMAKRTIDQTEANRARAYAWWYRMITPRNTMDGGDFTGA